MLGEWLFPVSLLMGSRRLGTSVHKCGFSVKTVEKDSSKKNEMEKHRELSIK